MRLLILALLLGVHLAHGVTPPASETARNLDVLKLYGELGRRNEHAQQAALWAPDALNNGVAVTPENIRAQLEDLYRTFPDLQSEVLETKAIDDFVIVLQRTSGTHSGVARTDIYGGMLRGVRPTGKRFEILRTHWWRLKDGRIVWHQVVADDLGMMRQLGLIADTLPADKLIVPAKE
jgi:predicted ester cyclase